MKYLFAYFSLQQASWSSLTLAITNKVTIAYIFSQFLYKKSVSWRNNKISHSGNPAGKQMKDKYYVIFLNLIKRKAKISISIQRFHKDYIFYVIRVSRNFHPQCWFKI